MTFNECFQEAEALSNKFDVTTKKTNLFVESVKNELSINLQEAELKVLQESGTTSDYLLLAEAAIEDSNSRVVASIKKLLDTLIEFLDKMKTNIQKAFMKSEVNDLLATAEKAGETNPKIKSQDVTYTDVESEVTMLHKFSNKLAQKIARAKIGRLSEKDLEDLKSEHESIEKKRKITGTDKSISFNAAVALVSRMIDNIDDICDESISDAKSKKHFIETANLNADEASTIQICFSIMSQIYKEIVSVLFVSTKSLITGIKSALSSAKSGAKEDTVEESVEEDINEIPEQKVFDESAFLDNLENELFKESEEVPEEEETPVEESTDDFISEMEKELFGEEITESADDMVVDESVLDDISAIIDSLDLGSYTESVDLGIPSADDLLAELDNIEI